jgi:large subunit ribosomal protein L5
MASQKSRLKKTYEKEVVSQLKKEFGIKNTLAVPKISKVIVNMGVGDAVKDKGVLERAKADIAAITGQIPSERAAKVSVASFSIRRGMIVGLKTTLRGSKMYVFLDKLFSIVLPRLRDFRGLSKDSFDEHGNYTIGLEEHIVFPEIDLAKSTPHGLEITIVTNTKDKEKAEKLMELMGMPFEKK